MRIEDEAASFFFFVVVVVAIGHFLHGVTMKLPRCCSAISLFFFSSLDCFGSGDFA